MPAVELLRLIHARASPRTAKAVSLTGQLAGGERGRWCAANLTGTHRLAADMANAAATGGRPLRPSRVEHPDHWAVIGGAFGQRLAFATHHALSRARRELPYEVTTCALSVVRAVQDAQQPPASSSRLTGHDFAPGEDLARTKARLGL